MKSYIVRERSDGSRYFDENTPAGNITPEIAGEGLEFSGGKLNVDGTDLVHKSGDESVEGTKTFVASPVVPTVPDVEDASTKAANTAFVQGALSPVKSDVEGIKDQIKDLKVATQNMTFYVRKTGNDNNDGLTEGTAVLTIKKAISLAYKYYYGGLYRPAVNIGVGTWDEGQISIGAVPSGANEIVIQGVDVDATVVGNSFYIHECAVASISRMTVTGSNTQSLITFNTNSAGSFGNMKLQAGSGVTFCARAYAGAMVTLDSNTSFTGNVTGALLNAGLGGIIYAIGKNNLVFSGSGSSAISALEGSKIELGSSSATIAGAFSAATVQSLYGAMVSFIGTAALSGASTGSRYRVVGNGIIATEGKGTNFIPGNAVGTVSNGGIYM